MWISDKWRDYELLDCEGGERLERWGEYVLIRPDPQVIWFGAREHGGWYDADARYERSASGGGRWLGGSDLPHNWQISYNDYLKFNVSLHNFKHTGLFPEQAVNWDFIREAIELAGVDREPEILNLFAYTGGATLAAAAAGASVCHVDAAKGMVAKARENAALSGLKDKPIRWIVDDCAKFVQRELRRGKKYDAVIMDPPSFGRGPGGEVWKLEDNLYAFVEQVSKILSDNPLFVIINSYTTGLSPATLTYVIKSILGGEATSRELALPVSKSGLLLPCGAACRWQP